MGKRVSALAHYNTEIFDKNEHSFYFISQVVDTLHGGLPTTDKPYLTKK